MKVDFDKYDGRWRTEKFNQFSLEFPFEKVEQMGADLAPIYYLTGVSEDEIGKKVSVILFRDQFVIGNMVYQVVNHY